MTSAITGQQLVLSHGDYRAVVTEVGATLRMLTWRGRDLVLRFGADEIMPLYRGAVLSPWPNVVRNGRYCFDGVEHVLDVSARTGGHALHGFAQWEAWRIAHHSSEAVTLQQRIWPRPGYPFRLTVSASYALSDDGLHWRVSAVNEGSHRAPYGSSVHPYLVAPTGAMDDWQLTLDAGAVIPVGAQDDTPTPVQDTGFDFRHRRTIGDLVLDHTYGDVTWTNEGTAGTTLVDAEGDGVRMTWERSCPWVQVYTSDWPAPALHRRGLAVEPMTCPPNAFNSRTDLIVLEPGDAHSASWWLSAVQRGAPAAGPQP